METQTTEMTIPEGTMDSREALDYADKHGFYAVQISDFTNRWPNRWTEVGDTNRSGTRVVTISRMNSSGHCFAVLAQ